MRVIISHFLLFLSLFALGQRQSFVDPDLSWSFKKPKNWEIYDNGLVVKVTPGVSDSANTFLTITYFESAHAFGSMNTYDPESTPVTGKKESTISKEKTKTFEKIGSYTLEVETRNKPCEQASCIQKRYAFMHHGQRWEIETSKLDRDAGKHEKKFRKIIRSLRIKSS